MKIKYPLACAALLASILSCPIAAEDTTPIAEEIHNRIAYGTPTIDGYLDSAYMQSARCVRRSLNCDVYFVLIMR